MALLKTIEFKGTNLDYCKIILMSNDFLDGLMTNVRVGVYVDKAARTADVGNFMKVIVCKVPGVDLTRAQVYELLKALPEFSGAVDA